MKRVLRVLTLALVAVCPVCLSQVSLAATVRPVVIFDTDMGSDVDDAGALAVLHRLADLGEAEIAGVIFSYHFRQGSEVGRAALGFLSFCLLASSVYTLNDLRDVEQDRVHPKKRLRPIPSGALPARAASNEG